ncbi:hypothetical protein SGPA1_30026 [Streptomyces misionensis JCM 4497]
MGGPGAAPGRRRAGPGAAAPGDRPAAVDRRPGHARGHRAAAEPRPAAPRQPAGRRGHPEPVLLAVDAGARRARQGDRVVGVRGAARRRAGGPHSAGHRRVAVRAHAQRAPGGAGAGPAQPGAAVGDGGPQLERLRRPALPRADHRLPERVRAGAHLPLLGLAHPRPAGRGILGALAGAGRAVGAGPAVPPVHGRRRHARRAGHGGLRAARPGGVAAARRRAAPRSGAAVAVAVLRLLLAVLRRVRPGGHPQAAVRAPGHPVRAGAAGSGGAGAALPAGPVGRPRAVLPARRAGVRGGRADRALQLGPGHARRADPGAAGRGPGGGDGRPPGGADRVGVSAGRRAGGRGVGAVRDARVRDRQGSAAVRAGGQVPGALGGLPLDHAVGAVRGRGDGTDVSGAADPGVRGVHRRAGLSRCVPAGRRAAVGRGGPVLRGRDDPGAAAGDPARVRRAVGRRAGRSGRAGPAEGDHGPGEPGPVPGRALSRPRSA